MSKIAGWIASMVDPDQTPLSAASWIFTVCTGLSVWMCSESTVIWSNRTPFQKFWSPINKPGSAPDWAFVLHIYVKISTFNNRKQHSEITFLSVVVWQKLHMKISSLFSSKKKYIVCKISSARILNDVLRVKLQVDKGEVPKRLTLSISRIFWQIIR